MKYSKTQKVKLIPSIETEWEGWGFDKTIVVRPVIKVSGIIQQYIIKANEGEGATLCVKETEILSR